MSEEYYLQDSRSYVGNDMLFWADAGGYTTDVSKAEVFDKERVQRYHKIRETDIPWPKEYIDNKTRPAVDMQYVRIGEALAYTGIVIIKPKPYRKPTYRCGECGVFMSEVKHYTAPCEKCGCRNEH